MATAGGSLPRLDARHAALAIGGRGAAWSSVVGAYTLYSGGDNARGRLLLAPMDVSGST